jgi:hypothetical protein
MISTAATSAEDSIGCRVMVEELFKQCFMNPENKIASGSQMLSA